MASSRKQPWRRRQTAGLLMILVLLGGPVALVLSRGNFAGRETKRTTRNIGEDRLVAFAPLPETEGPMCELVPASATSSLMAALSAQQAAAAAKAPDGAAEPRPSRGRATPPGPTRPSGHRLTWCATPAPLSPAWRLTWPTTKWC